MNNLDQYIKNKAAQEQIDIPLSVKSKIEETLATLPENKTDRTSVLKASRIMTAAACILFVTLFLLPNMSLAYAQALEQIPVIGNIIRVVTIRNYFYSDDHHEMDINVPILEDENSESFDSINAEIKELTDNLVRRFYKDLESIGDNGHSSLYVDYEMITNTDIWFTLKLHVYEASGTGNIYYKYYHLNKLTGKTVKLGDIAKDESFYDIVEQDIKKQMQEAMKNDGNLKYWIQDSIFGNDILSIGTEHNFYLNKDGNLVIPFDKYEISPGYMGTPEFVIDKKIIKDTLKDEFKAILNQ